MNEKRTSLLENGLIWFGAAVSIAEIITGTYIAPLGFKKGLIAVVLGHIIACVMLFFVGVIGGVVRKSSMETVKMSFGSKGAGLFSVLNIIQLLGWTAIMIYDGAAAANNVFEIGNCIWCAVIGALIILWISIGIKDLGKLNFAAVSALFILSVVLSFIVFGGKTDSDTVEGSITFGRALELSVAVSFAPIISDYTREAEKPVKATAVSVLTYTIVSSWMYIIGMGAAIFTGESDVSRIMLRAGIGLAGIVVIIFSTVTTTFLDAYSAGVSGEALTKRVNGKWLAVAVTIVGTVGAMILPLADFTDFLYFIGSVFAPMTAILLSDFYILKRNNEKKSLDVRNLVIWALGFIIYRLFMRWDIIIGCTLADVILTILICIIVNIFDKKQNNTDKI